MARKVDLAEYTKIGLEKLEAEWLASETKDSRAHENNPFQQKLLSKIRRKEITAGKPRSSKEDKEIKQQIIEKVYAEWEKINKEDMTPRSLRSIRRTGGDRDEEASVPETWNSKSR